MTPVPYFEGCLVDFAFSQTANVDIIKTHDNPIYSHESLYNLNCVSPYMHFFVSFSL